MKRIVIILIGCLAFAAFAACGDNQGGTQDSSDNSGKDSTDTPLRGCTTIAVADTMAELKVQIDSLNKHIGTLEDEIKAQKTSTEDLKTSKANKYFWLIIGLPALLVVVLIITIRKFANRSSEMEKIGKDVRSFKKKADELEMAQGDINSKIRSIDRNSRNYAPQSLVTSTGTESLRRRIDDLESRLQKLEKATIAPAPRSEFPTTEDVYFGNIKHAGGKLFFNEIYRSREDKAIFKAHINGKEGTFELFDINRVKSNDDIDKVIKIEGSVAMKDANSFQPIRPGKVHFEKIDGQDRWVLDTPVEIRLTK